MENAGKMHKRLLTKEFAFDMLFLLGGFLAGRFFECGEML
jgi:hypothetical protein